MSDANSSVTEYVFKGRDRTGEKIGRWTILRFSHCTERRAAYWFCRCECGTERIVQIGGNSQSCGCLHLEAVSKHGKYSKAEVGSHKARIYHVYHGVEMRCNNSDDSSYPNYGGRGIRCLLPPFEEFYEVFGKNIGDDKQIDRIDNNGHYELKNLRVADRTMQCNNRRSNVSITANGITLNIGQWAKHSGIDPSSIYSRLEAGWCKQCAVSIRPRQGKCQHISKPD